MPQLGANFDFESKQPNFKRDQFETLEAMAAYTICDDGHVTYCKEDGERYEFKESNSVDPTTGKWRLFKTGGEADNYIGNGLSDKVVKVDVEKCSVAEGGSNSDVSIECQQYASIGTKSRQQVVFSVPKSFSLKVGDYINGLTIVGITDYNGYGCYTNPKNIELLNNTSNTIVVRPETSYDVTVYVEASGEYSHAEGLSKAEGTYSHSEGAYSYAEGECSHAEGCWCEANGSDSHAEGSFTKALNNNSHAEGISTIARGDGSHAEGRATEAIYSGSHSEGYHTIAKGNYSHAEGQNTSTSNTGEHAEGVYNISHTGSDKKDKTIHSVGIGTSTNVKNAHEIMMNGDHYFGDGDLFTGEYGDDFNRKLGEYYTLIPKTYNKRGYYSGGSSHVRQQGSATDDQLYIFESAYNYQSKPKYYPGPGCRLAIPSDSFDTDGKITYIDHLGEIETTKYFIVSETNELSMYQDMGDVDSNLDTLYEIQEANTSSISSLGTRVTTLENRPAGGGVTMYDTAAKLADYLTPGGSGYTGEVEIHANDGNRIFDLRVLTSPCTLDIINVDSCPYDTTIIYKGTDDVSICISDSGTITWSKILYVNEQPEQEEDKSYIVSIQGGVIVFADTFLSDSAETETTSDDEEVTE